MKMNMNDIKDIKDEKINYYMARALELAKIAAELDEVPVGAVVVCEDKIVGEGYNTRESGKNALYHAEIKAIDEACRNLGGWRLHKCDIFVTLEPCMMCAGAIINSRIKTVYYGADDIKAGGFGGVVDLNSYKFNHKPQVVGGIMREEASELLSEFFVSLRKSRKQS